MSGQNRLILSEKTMENASESSLTSALMNANEVVASNGKKGKKKSK